MNEHRTKERSTESHLEFGVPDSPLTGKWQAGLWICMAGLWWLGSFLAWLGLYTQRRFMVDSDTGGDAASASGLLTGGGIFILLVSATLRLPIVTTSTRTTPTQNSLVWLLCLGANVNWLGMLCLSAETLWPVLPLLCLALAGEYWLASQVCIAKFAVDSADPPNLKRSYDNSATAESPEEQSPVPKDASAMSAVFPQESNDGTVTRTMVDQILPNGCRQLSGEIFLSWEQGQKSQVLVVGLVPALHRVPDLEFETDGATTTTRCLNRTETGFRVEVKRQGALMAEDGMLAWSALEPSDTVDFHRSTSARHAESNSMGLA